MEKRKERYKAEIEGKFIHKAAKLFTIDSHSKNLFKENHTYLCKI